MCSEVCQSKRDALTCWRGSEHKYCSLQNRPLHAPRTVIKDAFLAERVGFEPTHRVAPI